MTNALKLAPVAEPSAAPLAEAAPAKKPDVIYHAISPESIDALLELAKVTERDTVFEMGCGDARLLIEAARRHRCKCVGVELMPELAEKARADAQAAGVADLVTIVVGDMFETDLRPASVVFLYILPHLNLRMLPQLLDLRPGSRIVSADFDIVHHVPDKVWQGYIPSENLYEAAFLYVTPLRRQVQPVRRRWAESRIVYDANDRSLLPIHMR